MPLISHDAAKSRTDWSDTYSKPQSRAHLAVEREIFGTSEGIRGHTTVAQANLLAERLALRPGMRLLDIGSGRGWPGLYLAKTTGCQVVLTDLPLPALRSAFARARRHRLQGRCSLAMASATRLPFRPRVFDAIVHTDVL